MSNGKEILKCEKDVTHVRNEIFSKFVGQPETIKV